MQRPSTVATTRGAHVGGDHRTRPRRAPPPLRSCRTPYSPPSLRHKLRTTVCGCFGSPDSGAERPQSGGGGRAKWRRRVAATGEFKYDPLSYALNFDEGTGSDDSDEGAEAAAAFRYRNFSSRLPPSPKPAAARRLTAVAIA